MLEARIVIPPTAIRAVGRPTLIEKLIDTFGGFTSYPAIGGFHDMGETIMDNVTVYDIAMPDTTASLERLAGIVGWLFEHTAEAAIYARLPGGHVAIVPRAKADALAVETGVARGWLLPA